MSLLLRTMDRVCAVTSGWIRFSIPAVVSFILLGSAFAQTQELRLHSGELLIGEVLDTSNAETVYLRSDLLGEISIPRSGIQSINLLPSPEVAEMETMQKPVEEAKLESDTDLIDEETLDDSTSFFHSTPVLGPTIESAGMLVGAVRSLQAPKSWSGRMRIGINSNSGDSEWKESYLDGKLVIKPAESFNFYRLSGSYRYRETTRSNGEAFKSTDKYEADFTYRRTFYDDWFLQHTLSWRVDQRRGLDRELQALLGLGYEYKWNERLSLLVGAGGGIEEMDSNFDDNRNGQNPVVNVFQEFSWQFYPKSELTQSYNYYANPEADDSYNYEFSAGLRFRLTELLGLEFSYKKEYDSDLGDGTDRLESQFRNSLIVFF